MVKGTRKPPARIRYEQSHPTLSCRLSKDTYDLLKQRHEDLGGVSFADFVKDALGIQQAKMPDIEEIKEQAGHEGYHQANGGLPDLVLLRCVWKAHRRGAR